MNLNLLLIITAVILLCMVVDGYKKGMVRSLISLISLLIKRLLLPALKIDRIRSFRCKNRLRPKYRKRSPHS